MEKWTISVFTATRAEYHLLSSVIRRIVDDDSLILDLIDNAKNAAFQDTRFKPLAQSELNDLEITISILSSIERINYKDEKDLLSKIYPHGVIISLMDRRAVYLPEVWEQLPERDVFLNSLKEKAGLPQNYFSKRLEAYKFDTTIIS